MCSTHIKGTDTKLFDQGCLLSFFTVPTVGGKRHSTGRKTLLVACAHAAKSKIRVFNLLKKVVQVF